MFRSRLLGPISKVIKNSVQDFNRSTIKRYPPLHVSTVTTRMSYSNWEVDPLYRVRYLLNKTNVSDTDKLNEILTVVNDSTNALEDLEKEQIKHQRHLNTLQEMLYVKCVDKLRINNTHNCLKIKHLVNRTYILVYVTKMFSTNFLNDPSEGWDADYYCVKCGDITSLFKIEDIEKTVYLINSLSRGILG